MTSFILQAFSRAIAPLTCLSLVILSLGACSVQKTNTQSLSEVYEVVVKFRDDVRARAQEDGSVYSTTGQDLSALLQIITEYDLTFFSLRQRSEADLEALEVRAARNSGRAQPDLGGMLGLDVSSFTMDELEEVAEALKTIQEVDFVSIRNLGALPPKK